MRCARAMRSSHVPLRGGCGLVSWLAVMSAPCRCIQRPRGTRAVDGHDYAAMTAFGQLFCSFARLENKTDGLLDIEAMFTLCCGLVALCDSHVYPRQSDQHFSCCGNTETHSACEIVSLLLTLFSIRGVRDIWTFDMLLELSVFFMYILRWSLNCNFVINLQP